MILTKLFERRSGLSNPDQWFLDWVHGGSPTAAGVPVTENSALRFDAVFACIKIISETCALLPRPVFERLGRARRRLVDHPVSRLISECPNDDMTAGTFWETIIGHATSYGNGYAEIEKSGNPDAYPTALRILTPDRVVVERDGDKERGPLIYRYRPEGTGVERLIDSDKVFHLVGFGFDGLQGYSPIEYHRQTIGAALANIQHSGSFYGRGATPGGVLEHPGKFKTAKAMQDFRDSWERLHQGSDNAFRTAVLQDGITYKPMTMSARDAQTVEMFKLTVRQIARVYRMPLHKLQDMDAATFSNIEYQAIEFVQDTIMPWTRRIEEEIKRKLFFVKDVGLFVEHVIEKLLQADIGARYNAFALALRNGWMSPNEVRQLENLNPIDGGDTYMVQAQMEPLDQLDKKPEPAPAAVRDPGKDDDDDDDDDDRMSLVAASYRGLFEDGYRRVIRVETDRLKAAANREQDFLGWLGPFYNAQCRHIRGVMEPIVKAAGCGMFALMAGRPASAVVLQLLEDYTAELADRHAQLGRGAAQQAAAAGDTPEAMDAVCASWANRPAQLAEQEVRLLFAAIANMVESN